MARSICLRALTGAPKTRQQLADLLAKRGVPDDAAERVLDRFGEVGLIDDAAFARAWVTSRQAGRGLSRRALKAELRAKGIDGEVAEEAVTLVDDQDEWDAARRLVARRVAGLRRVDRATAERRLIGMLARKGYGGGLASWVVREALDEDRAALDAAEDVSDDDHDLDEGIPAGIRRRAAGPHPEVGLDAWLP
ncbi:regulatory protein RecX [Geodermatophilus sp. SYSU D01186]